MQNQKKAIKRCILNKFRSYSNTETDILPAWWLAEYREKLDDYRKELFHEALVDLIENGIVEQVRGQGLGTGLKLTHKGDWLVYSCLKN